MGKSQGEKMAQLAKLPLLQNVDFIKSLIHHLLTVKAGQSDCQRDSWYGIWMRWSLFKREESHDEEALLQLPAGIHSPCLLGIGRWSHRRWKQGKVWGFFVWQFLNGSGRLMWRCIDNLFLHPQSIDSHRFWVRVGKLSFSCQFQ